MPEKAKERKPIEILIKNAFFDDLPDLVGTEIQNRSPEIQTSGGTPIGSSSGTIPATQSLGAFNVSVSGATDQQVMKVEVPSGSSTPTGTGSAQAKPTVKPSAWITDDTLGRMSIPLGADTYFHRLTTHVELTTTIATPPAGAEATLASWTIPAGFLKVGRIIEGELWGVYTTPATPGTLTWKVKAGAATLVSSGARALTASLTDKGWHLKFRIVCITEGAAGSVEVQGWVRMDKGTDDEGWSMVNTAAVSLDTTVAQTLIISITFSAAGNSLTERIFLVESN